MLRGATACRPPRPILDTPLLLGAGEVTLTGRVLPIGGVKEKALAARRAGVKHILFPEGNRRDWDELTEVGDLVGWRASLRDLTRTPCP